MNKEIRYSGHTASPSDYDCQDGTLAVSMDLWMENGALKPVLQPQKILNTGSSDRTIVCVHETNSFTHYIALCKGEEDTYYLGYYDSDDVTKFKYICDYLPVSADNIYQTTTIGNTLVVLTSEGSMYYLWKDDAYIELGNHLPEATISFTLKGERVVTDESFTVNFAETQVFDEEFSDDNKTKVTSQVLAKVNKFIADKATNKGKFMMPFFVRYAYRLYDGSLTMHSAPILMQTSMETVPLVYSEDSVKDKYDSFKANVVATVYDLMFKCDNDGLRRIKDWSDIITSVDIFVSSPLYRYDQSGECQRLKSFDTTRKLSFGEFYSSMGLQEPNPSDQQTEWDYVSKRRYAIDHLGNLYMADFPEYKFHVQLPERSDFEDNIKDNSAFYLLKSIDLDDLPTQLTKIEIADDYFQSLVNREAMTDDYDSHDTLISRRAFGYNSRLNMSGNSKSLYDGYPLQAGLHYGNNKISTGCTSVTDAYVYLNKNGKTYIVHQQLEDVVLTDLPTLWFYYPSTDAYAVVITTQVGDASGSITYKSAKFSMKAHDFLNGSYYWSGVPDYTQSTVHHWYDDLDERNDYTDEIVEGMARGKVVEIKNKLYTSEVNNPFLFLVTNINTIGMGEILGVATAAKALSQGQFGTFPLYAFTTDGIWALEVSSTTGAFSARQPITRDVVVNPDSITQMDTAVLYATERGLMMISGSDTQCISEIIDNRLDDTIPKLPTFKGYDILRDGDDTLYDNFVNFRTFLANAGIIYDDTSRRIIVFNPTLPYAYVYSISGQSWGMMRSNIKKYILSYPEALAMDGDNNLLDYAKRIANKTNSGKSALSQLVFTRPMKLDYPDVLKTVSTIIQRGNFVKSHVQQILYGSRDLTHWFPVFSSKDMYLRGFRGTPYKYFRLAVLCNLLDSESLSGCSIEYVPRMNNQLR